MARSRPSLASSSGQASPPGSALSRKMVTRRAASSSCSRTSVRPALADERQWMSRGSSPSRNSRRPWKSPWRPLRPCASRPATRARGGAGVAELRQLRKDDDLGGQLDQARLAKEREGELGREAEARVGVAAAAREGVAIRGVLQAAGGELQEVALLVERAAGDEVLDLDGERGQAALAVGQADAHEEGAARVDAGGRLARDRQVAQRHLAHDSRGDDEREHHAEQEVEQVVAGVDGGEADADGDADEVFALARERQAARRSQPAAPRPVEARQRDVQAAGGAIPVAATARHGIYDGTAMRSSSSFMTRSASSRARPSGSPAAPPARTRRWARAGIAVSLKSSGTA